MHIKKKKKKQSQKEKCTKENILMTKNISQRVFRNDQQKTKTKKTK